ncbi:ORF-147 [Teiidae poxvirus 1]|nr:ORF-147 [Teiidae poxvirus 1]
MDYDMYFENLTAFYEYIESYGDLYVSHSNAAYVVVLIIYFVSFIIGFPSNCVIIWFMGFKWDKTVMTLLFMNLAIADLMFVLFTPLGITYMLMGYHWPFGSFICKLSSFVFQVGLFSSIFFITFISMDRYCRIFYPSFCHRVRTFKIVKLVTILIWLSSVILAIPFSYSKSTVEVDGRIDCYDNFHQDMITSFQIRNGIMCLSIIFGYIFPAVIMAICYFFIILNSSRYKWSMLVRVLAFFILWTPYNILALMLILGQHYESQLTFDLFAVIVAMVCLNGCVNPIIYSIMNILVSVRKIIISEDNVRLIVNEENDGEGMENQVFE